MATATARTESPPRAALHEREHPSCFACGAHAVPGLGLCFMPSDPAEEDGAGAETCAEWLPPAWAISYDNTVHGGLVATALDSTMVHTLFARGLAARTAELVVRYRHPVRPLVACALRGRFLGRRGPVHQLEATLRQSGRICARATATFFALASPAARSSG